MVLGKLEKPYWKEKHALCGSKSSGNDGESPSFYISVQTTVQGLFAALFCTEKGLDLRQTFFLKSVMKMQHIQNL